MNAKLHEVWIEFEQWLKKRWTFSKNIKYWRNLSIWLVRYSTTVPRTVKARSEGEWTDEFFFNFHGDNYE